jgi:hydrogenase-4 component B
MPDFPLLDQVMLAAVCWLVIGGIGIAFPRNFTLISRILFPLGALCSLMLAVLALRGIVGDPQVRILPFGLPDLPFHLRLDALSSFFLFLLGATSAPLACNACSITFFSPACRASCSPTTPTPLWSPGKRWP